MLAHLCVPCSSILVAQFTEGNQKVLGVALDGLGDFISLYKTDCPLSFLTDILNNLLTKAGTDLPAPTLTRITYALEIVRESFPAESQVFYLFSVHFSRHFQQPFPPFLTSLVALFNLTSRHFHLP